MIEERRHVPRAARADEPEPAILGRAEDESVLAEEAKGSGDVTGGERRDVAADQHHRTLRAGGEGTAHADTQIAAALAGNFDASAPTPGLTARLVRRHRDAQPPAPVGGEAAQQQRQHQALEAHRRDIANRTRKPALAAPQLGCADK
jgi:hypothetical protein